MASRTRNRVTAVAPSVGPLGVAGCVLWLRADMGITLGATPRANGTAPPVVTLSGDLAQALGVYLDVQTGGSRGTATFRWSVDNGTTYEESDVLTAATVDLGDTGITAAFAVGTYNADNTYEATVATWADQSGNGNDAVQATAADQLRYFAGAHPHLYGSNATTTKMRVATFGLTQPFTALAVATTTSIALGVQNLLDGSAVDTADVRLNAANSEAYAGAVPVVGPAAAAGAATVWLAEFNGASSAIALNSSRNAGNAGSAVPDGLTVGGYALVGAGRSWNGPIYEVAVFDTQLDAATRARLADYASARYEVTL